MNAMCSCSYCKDYRAYSPTRRELPPRHHMDGASAGSHNSGMRRTSGSHTPPRNGSSGPNASISYTPPSHHKKENEEQHTEDIADDKKMTTLKMKLPDIRKGGNTIQISLEVSGVLYEGVISASTPLVNGEHTAEEERREGTPVNGRS